MLLPPDLRDWIAADHMVHFVIDAVKALNLSLARTNTRGTGHAQYPPAMMLGLLTSSFHQVLELAARAKVFQVGDFTVAHGRFLQAAKNLSLSALIQFTGRP